MTYNDESERWYKTFFGENKIIQEWQLMWKNQNIQRKHHDEERNP